ncbi:MAG: penicillin-binding protein 2 [Hyphomicrobiales bacterium]
MQTPGTVFRDRFSDAEGVDASSDEASIVLVGSKKKRIDLSRSRLVLVALVFVAVYGVIGAKLTTLAMTDLSGETRAGVRVSNGLMTARPDIVDRNSEVMAKDLTTYSLHADPQKIAYPAEALDLLKEVLPSLDKKKLLKRLKGKGNFVWIEREMTPSQQARILDLGIPGLTFERETRRFYPGGRVASHMVGYVDIDNRGIAGFEKFVDDNWLDNLREVGLSPEERMAPVSLSVDMRVQHVVRDELSKAMVRYKAAAATGIILDANTGEVVAMSSLPDYDPNDIRGTFNSNTLNRATAGVFEMGSTFKAITTAMALDSGLVNMSSRFDARKPITHRGLKIRDFHAKRRVLSLPEVFIYSSNIGTAKMALEVGPNGHRDFLTRLGLFEKSRHELPEVGNPLSPKEWEKLSSMTISFGHGVSVTPLQTLSAAAAILNGGKLIPPTFRPRNVEDANDLATQVISPDTSAKMRYLFRLNVEKGSGRRAEVEGYSVGGKTGTAEKVVNGQYSSKKKLNSFLSAFPIDDPRYVMLVMIDEPKPLEGQRSATAGLNAAPTTAAIIRRVATTLGVAPRLDDTPVLSAIDYRR